MTKPSFPFIVRAVIQPELASNELIVSSTPFPELSDADKYIVKAKTASPCLNELTWERHFLSLFDPDRYRVPCTECSGIIVDGPVDGTFKRRDEVYYRTRPGLTGTLREYTIGKTSHMAPKPKSLDWNAAAATPLSALTAWQGLFEHGLLDKAAIHGDATAKAKNSKIRVLVTGAGGAVGSRSIQLATAAGAGAIIGVAVPSKAVDVRGFGATDFVDYTKQSIENWVAENPDSRKADLVLDCVGGATTRSCWAAIKNGGTFLSIGGQPGASKPESETKVAAKAEWYLVEPQGTDLAEITDLIDSGRVKPLVDCLFPFEKFAEAFGRVEGGKSKGKVIIAVSE